MNTAQTQFRAALVAAYVDLFANNPEYAFSASKCTPESLADKMMPALVSGGANYNGEGIKRACKACGIKYTGKSVRAFLDPVRNANEMPAACTI